VGKPCLSKINRTRLQGPSNSTDIDKCIAPIVQALNDAEIGTVASCCGHNKGFGNIALKDGRELIICPDFETARKLEKIIYENLS
jgi:hypothetical protein